MPPPPSHCAWTLADWRAAGTDGGSSPSWQHGVFEDTLGGANVWHDRFDQIPETRAVVHFAQVGELVGYDVIDDREGEVDQAPVEAEGACGVGAAPAGLGA